MIDKIPNGENTIWSDQEESVTKVSIEIYRKWRECPVGGYILDFIGEQKQIDSKGNAILFNGERYVFDLTKIVDSYGGNIILWKRIN